MKRSYVVLGVIGAIILFAFLGYYNSFNKAVKLQEEVNNKWEDVQAVYQKRLDLIPNLVKTVKGAAENETKILTNVTQARAGIVNAKTPEDMELMGKKINTAINLAYEAYPQIRSTENFQKFQDQLESTENETQRARELFNESVKEYNVHLRGFFNRIFLSSEEFPKKEGFKAAAGAENAPDVKF
jgi:LemA protein